MALMALPDLGYFKKGQRSSMVEGYLAGLIGYVSATCIRKIRYVFFLVSDFNS